MIAREIMKTDLITIGHSTTISQAISIMKEEKIRHLPIVDDKGHLIGIVSDRDLREAKPSSIVDDPNWEDTSVDEIMSTNLITGTPDDFIEEIAVLMYEFKISCVPILSNEKLIGIITATDLLYTFVQLTGAHEPSSRFELLIEDKPGILSEVTRVFQKCNVNIISVLVFPSTELNYKRLIIRARILNTKSLANKLKDEGYIVLWPEI